MLKKAIIRVRGNRMAARNVIVMNLLRERLFTADSSEQNALGEWWSQMEFGGCHRSDQ
jgi:hypothetical protein